MCVDRSAAFAGREQELEGLAPILLGARAALIVGDAGIGKTRLADELVQRHPREGQLVLAAACLPLASRLPLLPVVDVLRRLHAYQAGVLFDAALEDCPSFVRDELAGLLPELGGGGGGSGPGEGWQRERLFAALVFLLGVVGRKRPLVVMIEDLHWSDPATRDFVTYLLARLSDAGLSLLLTARSGWVEQTDDCQDWLRRIGVLEVVTRVALPPLSPAEVHGLAQSLTGSAVTEEMAADLCRRTEGNAFFIEQVLAAGADGSAATMSDELAQLLRARAAMVGPEPRMVLEVLAVAARPLSEQELSEVTGQDVPVVRHCLRSLRAAQLARPEGPSGFVARHALLAEAVAAALLPGERSDLHAAVAAVLAERHDSGLAAEVARHWSSADRPRQELPMRVEAAEYAESVYAFTLAADQWERAFDLAESVSAADAAGFALRGVVAWASAGDEVRGRGLGRRGAAVAEAHDQRQLCAALQSRVAMLGYFDNRNTGIAELTAAVALFADLPPSSDEVYALRRLYHMHRSLGHNREGMPYLLRAIEIGGKEPQFAVELVQTLPSLAYEQLRVGSVQSGLATMSRAREAAADESRPYVIAWLAAAETDALLSLNRLEDALAAGRPALEVIRSRGYGATFGASLLAGHVVDVLLALGRTDDAAVITDAMTGGQTIRIDTRSIHVAHCSVDVARGQLADAASRLEAILSMSVRTGLEAASRLARVRAELTLWTDAPQTTIETVRLVLRDLVGTEEERLAPPLLVLGMRGCADLAEAAAARRDRPAVRSATDQAEQLRRLAEGMHPDPFAEHASFVTAAADGADWRAELGRCRQEDTVPTWEAAARRWEALERPHRAAYARWRQAEALLGIGDRLEAITAVAQAWRQADQHVPLMTAIRAWARMARIDIAKRTDPGREADAPTAAVPKTSPYGLTERELDVLRLLVEGQTNAQIGARLYMSPKTASVHVSAILRKLQATNRVQAAAIAQRSGILGS